MERDCNNEIIKKNIITVLRKGRPVFVIKMKVKDLDVNFCSSKFLSNNLNVDTDVYVKCLPDGTLDLRGKRKEYRIIPIDK